jgi:hypothetical protein
MSYNIIIEGYSKNNHVNNNPILWIGTQNNKNIFFPISNKKYHLKNKPTKISYTYYNNSHKKIYIGALLKKSFKNQKFIIKNITLKNSTDNTIKNNQLHKEKQKNEEKKYFYHTKNISNTSPPNETKKINYNTTTPNETKKINYNTTTPNETKKINYNTTTHNKTKKINYNITPTKYQRKNISFNALYNQLLIKRKIR